MRRSKRDKKTEFEIAVRTLRALKGVVVTERPNELAIEVVGAHGLRYIVHPAKGRWLRCGARTNRFAHGGLSMMLADYRERKAEIDALARRKIDVTVFTDAGFCSRTGAAGWGCWMKGSLPDAVVHGGEIEELLPSSTEAEMRAGANALFLAEKRGLISAGSAVMWQSDSINALGWVLGAYPKSMDRPAEGGLAAKRSRVTAQAPAASAGLRVFVEIAARLELVIFTRHVRGHQPGSHRQWVNRLCDEIAGQHMRARRVRHLEGAELEKEGGRKRA